MACSLLIDIGSTYTKATKIDLETLEISARGQAYTTVKEDVTIGLKKALDNIPDWQNADYKLACSSAAGGLKIIAIGLVPDLTAEAARRAALGAGSKVLKTYSYELTDKEIEEIKYLEPDILLLAGGTDGGNKEIILHNAAMLANSDIEQTIIVAGNRSVSQKANDILKKSHKETFLTENVMPRLEELNIEPARRTIREIFLNKIIHAKGLKKVDELIDGIIMPTPSAVLKAAQLLAEGYKDYEGLGELMIVDIGGATTDVHSIASGKPTKANVNWRGLEEPYSKRTVEGDLGMRYSASSLYSVIGEENFLQSLRDDSDLVLDLETLERYIQYLHKNVSYLAQTKREKEIDKLLGYYAVKYAVARHVGSVKTIYTPMGATVLQEGKDLTNIETVIGTGGIIINNESPEFLLKGSFYENQDNPELLSPLKPNIFIDKEYILAAGGLMVSELPLSALKFMKKNLKKVK